MSELFPPERTVLHLLRSSLPTMSMLDIGVGGGRTAMHFGGLAREYVGIDYSAAMVNACVARFAGTMERRRFARCDARDMSMFASASFDLVLFSFNGIDNLDF